MHALLALLRLRCVRARLGWPRSSGCMSVTLAEGEHFSAGPKPFSLGRGMSVDLALRCQPNEESDIE
jgi:hypothetical protein